jgi:formyl-CoA transferase
VRHENGAALYDEIAKWTLARTKHEAMRILAEAGVPCSAVLDTRDLFQDPQLQARGFVQQVQHDVLGSVPMLGSPFRMSRSDVPLRAAPVLGRHTDEVLRADLGLSEADLSALHASGVVATKES